MRKARSKHVLVGPDRPLLLSIVLFVEFVDGLLGFGLRLLALFLAHGIPAGNFLGLFFPPFPM